MKKELQQKMVLRRKNFLPSLIIIIVLFLSLISIIYFTDPATQIFVLLLFINIFLFLFFLFALIFANSRRGFIISACITLFLIFRLFGIGNILNAILIASLGIITEIYAGFTKRTKKHILPNT